jgi:hypothetical protein
MDVHRIGRRSVSCGGTNSTAPIVAADDGGMISDGTSDIGMYGAIQVR